MGKRMPYPTDQEIRAALIERMHAFCAATGRAPSMVCRVVMNDTTFYAKLVAGGNFTIETYARFHACFDKYWPRRGAPGFPKPPAKAEHRGNGSKPKESPWPRRRKRKPRRQPPPRVDQRARHA
jgi:hypothetical protein